MEGRPQVPFCVFLGNLNEKAYVPKASWIAFS
jgi:hypothetical protein